MRMRTALFFIGVLFIAASTSAQVAPPPDESKTIGQPVPDVILTDDRGKQFRLSAFAGQPLIVSPIFTRCPHVCTMITSSLRDAVEPVEGLGKSYNVLTISFDPADTIESMRAYREELELPDAWKLAIASPDQLDAILTALDFQYVALEDGGFAHANVIAVVDGGSRIAGYVHGMQYKEEDVRAALTAAWAGDSLVGKYRNTIILVAAIAALALVLTLVLTGQRKKPQPA